MFQGCLGSFLPWESRWEPQNTERILQPQTIQLHLSISGLLATIFDYYPIPQLPKVSTEQKGSLVNLRAKEN